MHCNNITTMINYYFDHDILSGIHGDDPVPKTRNQCVNDNDNNNIIIN